MAEEKSKEDLLSNLPPELLNAEKVSNDDLIKFAPVLGIFEILIENLHSYMSQLN